MMLPLSLYFSKTGTQTQAQAAPSIKHFYYGMSSHAEYPFCEAVATEICNVPYRANVLGTDDPSANPNTGSTTEWRRMPRHQP